VGFDDRPADGEANTEAPSLGREQRIAQLVFTVILAGRARHGRDR
jgi:hypothetical protein